jgi:hypothetical protein
VIFFSHRRHKWAGEVEACQRSEIGGSQQLRHNPAPRGGVIGWMASNGHRMCLGCAVTGQRGDRPSARLQRPGGFGREHVSAARGGYGGRSEAILKRTRCVVRDAPLALLTMRSVADGIGGIPRFEEAAMRLSRRACPRESGGRTASIRHVALPSHAPEAANRAGIIVMFLDKGTGSLASNLPTIFTPPLFSQPPIGIASLSTRPISLPVRLD